MSLEDIEYLAATERPIGHFHLSRHWRPEANTWVHEAFIDGALLMSDVSPLSERELARRAIEAHAGDGPLRILVGGLGLGHTADAALASPRATYVRVVDAMDFVIGWLKDGLLPLSERLTTDPRVELVLSDVYDDLLGPAQELWDLLLIDVDHAPDYPLDPKSLPFYTPEGQRQVARHLAPGGLLVVWSAFDNDAFAQALSEVYAESWRETIDWVVPYADGEDQRWINTLFFARREAPR